MSILIVIKIQVLGSQLLVTSKPAILLSLAGFLSDLRAPFTVGSLDEKSTLVHRSAIM